MKTLKEQPISVLEIYVYEEFEINPAEKKIRYIFYDYKPALMWVKIDADYFTNGTWTRAPGNSFGLFNLKPAY